MLRLDGSGPLYMQVAQALRLAIRRKQYAEGERLPGSRSLAGELGVSRNVVLAAFEQLTAEGYLEPAPKSGTFVAASLPDDRSFKNNETTAGFDCSATPALTATAQRIVSAGRQALKLSVARQNLRYNFEYGIAHPDPETLAEIKRLHHRVLRAKPFDYDDPAGDLSLREQIAIHVGRTRAINANPSQVVITSGSQQALDLCARLLVEAGDSVVMEDPVYQGASQAFAAAGAKLCPVPVDHDGLDTREMIRLVPNFKLIYVTPSHQFPSGAVMPVGRRLKLLEIAAGQDGFIIEDDYDGEFRYDCRPLEAIASLADDSPVIYLGTFAKSLFPSLRTGYLILPNQLVEPFRYAKWLTDRGNALIYQRVLAELMRSGGYQRHLRRMTRRYSRARERLVSGLQRVFGDEVTISGTNAGTHLVCWFNHLTGNCSQELISRCQEQGVGVYPIEPYYSKRPANAGLLMGFSGLSEEDIDPGIQLLAECYRNLIGQPE